MAIAIIPARSGSKGLPGKNTRKLGEYPLIAWTVFAALKSGVFSDVVVATDDKRIAEVAKTVGANVPFLRPAELASDAATTLQVVVHTLDVFDFTDDWFALLQPTSPFRSSGHIKAAVSLMNKHGSSVVSVTDDKPLSWAFLYADDGTLTPALPRAIVSRRQNQPSIVRPNGALYLQETEVFRRDPIFYRPDTVGYKMSTIDSIDIDDAEDFALAEAIVGQGLRVPET